LISKGQAIMATIMLANKKPQDLYAKVIDQYGNPVASASVAGELVLNDGTYGGVQVKKHNTATDVNGLFEFTDLHGAGFSVRINKEGYKLGDRGEGYKSPASGNSSPTDRAIFTMWKLRGAEPLTHSDIRAKIPHDGTAVAFDMMTGKVSPNGDFRVTLSQFPLEIKTGRERFDWAARIEILNGGMIEEKDAYPFWAPENGYQPSFDFITSSNAIDWIPILKKNFYIKTAQGQYGLMKFAIYPGRSPTGLEVNFTLNPSGSQNLEPDFSK